MNNSYTSKTHRSVKKPIVPQILMADVSRSFKITLLCTVGIIHGTAVSVDGKHCTQTGFGLEYDGSRLPVFVAPTIVFFYFVLDDQ